MRGKGPHYYTCPSCDSTVTVHAAHHVRQRNPCTACVRVRNGWRCASCGTADPHHDYALCLSAQK